MTEPLMNEARMNARLRGVIVEGPDCSGKTTLVKKLKEAVAGRGWDVMQMGHKPGDQFKRYMDVYLRADRLLLDRSHFSEVVYGNLWRGGRHFAPWERALLDDVAGREFITVLCTAPPDVLRTREVTRDWPRLYAAFEATMREHIENRSLVLAQSEFAAVVAPRADIVCEALADSDLDRAAAEVLDRLRRSSLLDALDPPAPRAPRARRGEGAGLDYDPEIVIVVGAASPRTTAFAAQLARALDGWRFVSSQDRELSATFASLMRDCLSSSRVVVEDRCFSALFGSVLSDGLTSGGLTSEGPTSAGRAAFSPFEVECLCRYVSARGLVVVIETIADRAGGRGAGADLLRRWDIPHATVRLDDRAGLDDRPDFDEAIASTVGRIRGAMPAGA